MPHTGSEFPNKPHTTLLRWADCVNLGNSIFTTSSKNDYGMQTRNNNLVTK